MDVEVAKHVRIAKNVGLTNHMGLSQHDDICRNGWHPRLHACLPRLTPGAARSEPSCGPLGAFLRPDAKWPAPPCW